jgi:hypothetical protein
MSSEDEKHISHYLDIFWKPSHAPAQAAAKAVSDDTTIAHTRKHGENMIHYLGGFEEDKEKNARRDAQKEQQMGKSKVVHHGASEGTKDLKGDKALVGKHKTDSGKIKSPPKKSADKKEMASDLIRYHMHHLGRHPGGRQQAIAIGLRQAGMSKEGKSMDKSLWDAVFVDADVQLSASDALKSMSMLFDFDLSDIGKAIEEGDLSKAYVGFNKLKKEIGSKGKVDDPAAVAASIGRKKYGSKTFQEMANTGTKGKDVKKGEADSDGQWGMDPKTGEDTYHPFPGHAAGFSGAAARHFAGEKPPWEEGGKPKPLSHWGTQGESSVKKGEAVGSLGEKIVPMSSLGLNTTQKSQSVLSQEHHAQQSLNHWNSYNEHKDKNEGIAKLHRAAMEAHHMAALFHPSSSAADAGLYPKWKANAAHADTQVNKHKVAKGDHGGMSGHEKAKEMYGEDTVRRMSQQHITKEELAQQQLGQQPAVQKASDDEEFRNPIAHDALKSFAKRPNDSAVNKCQRSAAMSNLTKSLETWLEKAKEWPPKGEDPKHGSWLKEEHRSIKRQIRDEGPHLGMHRSDDTHYQRVHHNRFSGKAQEGGIDWAHTSHRVPEEFDHSREHRSAHHLAQHIHHRAHANWHAGQARDHGPKGWKQTDPVARGSSHVSSAESEGAFAAQHKRHHQHYGPSSKKAHSDLAAWHGSQAKAFRSIAAQTKSYHSFNQRHHGKRHAGDLEDTHYHTHLENARTHQRFADTHKRLASGESHHSIHSDLAAQSGKGASAVHKSHGGKGPARTGKVSWNDAWNHGGKGPNMKGVYHPENEHEDHGGKGRPSEGTVPWNNDNDPNRGPMKQGTVSYDASTNHPGKGPAQTKVTGPAEHGRSMSKGDKEHEDWQMEEALEGRRKNPMNKALSARAMPRLPRAVAMQHDAWRSATNVMTRGNSRFDVDPTELTPDSLAELPEEVRKSAYIACKGCGRTYMVKSFPSGCPTCNTRKANVGHSEIKW